MLLVRSLLPGTRGVAMLRAVLWLTVGASLVEAGVGGAGGAFLRGPAGAGAFALGGAQTASPTYLCSWWNPAALSRKATKLSMGVGYRPLGRPEGAFSWEFPVPPRVGMGFGLVYRGAVFREGDLVDDQENPLDGGAFTSVTLKTGFSYLAAKRLSAGMSMTVFWQRMPYDHEDGKLRYSSPPVVIGLDLAARYVPGNRAAFGLVVRNLLAHFAWQFDYKESWNTSVNDTLPVEIALGSEVTSKLLGCPFIWSCDITGRLFNGHFRPLDKMYAVVNNGFEWQRWETLALRMGLRDIVIERDMVSHSESYRHNFSWALSAGVSIDLRGALGGRDARFNYGLSTDKAGRFLDQQFDVVMGF